MTQKGYTLIELMAVMAITGMIVLTVASSIFQVAQGRIDVAQKSVAMADIDNVAHWLVRDLVMAQTNSLTEGAPPVSDMTMEWSDLTAWAGDEGSVEHYAGYTLSGTQLLRDYDGEETIIGRHLTDVGFSVEGKMFTFTLTSRSGLPGSAVTRSFLVQMRSDLGP